MANWGIIGTGNIAGKFARGLAGSPSERLLGAASRDAARAAAFAAEHGAARSYGSYEALLADPEVELVYLALPNSAHREWAVAAAAAGKHVLCEKPLALTAPEAEAMFAAARARGTWLMEGFMYRFHPQTRRLQELIAEGAIGEVRLVQASFGITVDDPANVRLDPALGGGALYDVGCYCVNLARLVVGAAPLRVTAAARWTERGVDEALLGTLEYPGGASAQIACGMAYARHQHALIVGSHGTIALAQPFGIMPDEALSIRLLRGSRHPTLEEIAIPPADQLRLEAEGFSALVAAGHQASGLPQMPLVETLENASTLDALLASARSGQSVEL